MAGAETVTIYSIGILLKPTCKTSKDAPNGLTRIQDFDQESQDLLIWRSGLSEEDLQTVCYYHVKVFLTCFESSQLKCCDPLNRHKIAVRAALRQISTVLAFLFNITSTFST